MKWLKIGALIIATCFVAVIVVLSGIMNFRFGSSFGASEFDKDLLGYLSLCIDGFKSMLPVIGGIALIAGVRSLWIAAWSMWVVAAVLSYSSSFGFVVQARQDTKAILSAQVERRQELKTERGSVSKQTKKLRARPLSVVQADYESKCDTKRRKRWRSCKRLWRERGRALAIKEGRAVRATIDIKKSNLTVTSGEDQQVKVVSDLLAKTPFLVMVGIALGFSAIVEMVSGFGPAMIFAAFQIALVGRTQAQASFHLPGFLSRLMRRKNPIDLAPGGVVETTIAPTYVDAKIVPVAVEVPVAVDDGKPAWLIKSLLSSSEQRGEDREVRRVVQRGAGRPTGSIELFFKRVVQSGSGKLTGVEVYGIYQKWCSHEGSNPVEFRAFHEGFAVLVKAMSGTTVTADPRGRRFADKISYDGIVFRKAVPAGIAGQSS